MNSAASSSAATQSLPVVACVSQPTQQQLYSSSATLTAGWTSVNPSADPLNPSLYSDGSLTTQSAIVTPNTSWLPASGQASWISDNPVTPGLPGGEGIATQDQWRLFQTSFTDSDATPTPITLYYTGDNAVTVYLNGTAIANTTDVSTYGPMQVTPFHVFAQIYSTTFTPVSGTNTLDFVVRNVGGNYTTNPTGLLYYATYQINGQCVTPVTSTTTSVSSSAATTTSLATAGVAQLPNGCGFGNLFSPLTGARCVSQTTGIAGCGAGNKFSTLTGQLCGGLPQLPSSLLQQLQSGSQQSGTATMITSPAADPVSVGTTTAALTGQFSGSWPTSTAVGWFYYGTSPTSLTQSTAPVALSSITNTNQVFDTVLSNLQPNTTYYYEAVGEAQPEGMGGEAQGSVVSFTTTGNTTTGSTTTACPATTPSITVVSPNGGETYTAGQQITVSWTSCNIPAGDLVNVNLLRPDPTSGSYTAHVVTTPDASNTFPVSNGSAPITISATGVWPATVQYGNVYKILLDVLTPSTGGMGDNGAVVAQGWSANTFTISQ